MRACDILSVLDYRTATAAGLHVHRSGPVLFSAPRVLQPVRDGLVREVAVLVRIEIVDPWIRSNAILGSPDDVELPIVTGLADARPQPGMVVLLVDLDRPLRRLELLAGKSFKISASVSVLPAFSIACASR